MPAHVVQDRQARLSLEMQSLDRLLAQVYQDPVRARRAPDGVANEKGVEAAAAFENGAGVGLENMDRARKWVKTAAGRTLQPSSPGGRRRPAWSIIMAVCRSRRLCRAARQSGLRRFRLQ